MIQGKRPKAPDSPEMDEVDVARIDRRIAWLQTKRSVVRGIDRGLSIIMQAIIVAVLGLGAFYIQYKLYEFNRCYEVQKNVRSCF